MFTHKNEYARKFTPEEQLSSKKDSYLLCSLYTLIPNDPIFKKLCVKNKLHVTLNQEIFHNEKSYLEFSYILNKSSLRRLSYSIIEDFLIKKTFPKESKIVRGQETLLLILYLAKFKFTYYSYFFNLNEKTANLPPDKELNNYAIQSLFLILGI